MDLTTHYLGIDLANPFLPGASPLSDEMDDVLRLEDAGAPAIVMSSLFEEELVREELAALRYVEAHHESFAEATSYLHLPDEAFGLDPYLAKLIRIKERVSIPVIASLNGTTAGGWLRCARELQEAGADALELNVYEVPSDPRESGAEVEERTVAMVREMTNDLRISVAVKVSPFYSSFAHFAGLLERAGADALVLFNRFYQPDIDPEEFEVRPAIRLSDSSELLLRLRWVALLSPRLGIPLAVTGGVHDHVDAVKSFMAGASVVQVVSALLRRGPRHLETLRRDFLRWMEEHEYDSLAELRGCMDLERSPDPRAYERANYIRVLQSW